MNTQSVTLSTADSVNLTNISDSIKCEESFEKLMQQINEEKDIEEMKQFLNKKFNVTTIVSDYSCETTDSKAENYDLFMLDKYDMHGARNVVISRKSLLRMKKDSIFRQKVYKSIEDLGCTSNMTGGIVKSTGVFIHEDSPVTLPAFFHTYIIISKKGTGNYGYWIFTNTGADSAGFYSG